MIFGEFFVSKNYNGLIIKVKEDGYKKTVVQNKNFSNFLKPSHKINVLKSKVYKLPKKGKKINEISFGSKIKVTKKLNI